MALVYSAGVVPVRQSKGKSEYLLMRSRHYIDFPKGKLEDNETFLGAALRETKEESGLWDLDFAWGTVYKETDPYKTKSNGKKAKKVSRYYLARVNSGEVKIVPNEETGVVEHDNFYWVTYEEAKDFPLQPRIKEILDWARSLVENENVNSVSEES